MGGCAPARRVAPATRPDRRGRPPINRRTVTAAAAGVAGLALAAGTAALAVTTGSGTVAGNFIGSGHLEVQVDGSTAPVDVGVGGLMPGQGGSVDELVTADMAGVPAAQLSLTVAGAAGAATVLTVTYSAALPVDDLGWDGTRCAPKGGFAHVAAAVAAEPGAALGTLTPGKGLCVRFTLDLPSSAGNAVQGELSDYAIAYHLQQSEPGSAQTEAAGP